MDQLAMARVEAAEEVAKAVAGATADSAQLTKLDARVRSLSKINQELQASLAMSESELKVELSQALRDRATLEREAIARDHRVATVEMRQIEFEQVNGRLRIEMAAARAEAQAERNRAAAVVARFNAELAARDADLQRSRRQAAGVQRDAAVTSVKVAALEAQAGRLEAARQALYVAQQERARLDKQLSAVTRDRARQAAELKALVEQHERVRTQNVDIRGKLNEVWFFFF